MWDGWGLNNVPRVQVPNVSLMPLNINPLLYHYMYNKYTTVKNSSILDHAAQVYTRKIFKLFENEFLNSLAMV